MNSLKLTVRLDNDSEDLERFNSFRIALGRYLFKSIADNRLTENLRQDIKNKVVDYEL
jgi:hypothetical protein